MRRFNFRIGDIEARVTTLNLNKSNETVEINETIEIVLWEEDVCHTLAFFTDYKCCNLLQNGMHYESPEELMKVIRVANKFLKNERLTEEGFPPLD